MKNQIEELQRGILYIDAASVRAIIGSERDAANEALAESKEEISHLSEDSTNQKKNTVIMQGHWRQQEQRGNGVRN